MVARQLDAVLDKRIRVRERGAGLRAGLGDRHRAHRDAGAGAGGACFPAEEGAVRRRAILYGGSVKPENAAALFAMPDVDGGLIGGASLVAEEFLAICARPRQAKG